MLSRLKNLRAAQKLAFLILGALVITGVAANGMVRSRDSELPFPAGQSTAVGQFEGELVPAESLNLGFNASAQVTEVLVKEGDLVAKGDVLARLGNRKRLMAQEAAAEYELLRARHALDQLNRNAALDLAQAGVDRSAAELDRSLAEAKVRHLKTPPSRLEVDQAYANMLLAEHKLQKTRDDLRRAEKKYANKKDIMWYFVGRHEYKLLLDKLNRDVAQAALRYERAQDKYDDLIESVDPVDLALAEAELAMADARVAQATRTQTALLSGPDPDDLSMVEARIQAARTALLAAQAALRDSQLVAPTSGKVVEIKAKAGEWTAAGSPAIILADTSRWLVETQDLTEMEVPSIKPGQSVQLLVKALPLLKLEGSVQSISSLATERGGDVFYTVKIRLDESDPRLRWGMTVDTLFDTPPN